MKTFERRLTSPRSWCSRRSVVLSCAAAAFLAAAPPASPHPGHAPIEVDIANHAFAPRDVQIYQGDSIIFTWKGPDTNHSATGDDFDSDAGKQPAAVFHPIGDTYAVTFNKVGSFSYHCKVHPSMTGTVNVQAVPGPPTPVAPTLSRVSTSPRTFARRTTLHFTLDSPSSMRAILKRGSRTLKEVDFLAHPGANTHQVNFGKRLRPGKAVLRLVAVDPTSGLSSKTASLRVQVAAAAKSSSLRYPPITCGRITVKSTRYVVKTHGPSCTTAIRGVKGFMANHTSPRFYRCRSYGGDIPAYCIGAIEKYKRRYFFANKG